MKIFIRFTLATIAVFMTTSALAEQNIKFKAGHQSLQHWILPATPAAPDDNATTPERVELGKKLFFDPRISGDGNMSCASCHSPLFGWSDGLATAKGHKSKLLGRASPTVINTAYNALQMWDGRKRNLEDQATGPMDSRDEMSTDYDSLFSFLKGNKGYITDFEKAYPGEGINKSTLARAIASFERTIISNNSPFDQWVKGDKKAMTKSQVRGFKIFSDPNKGNCAVCHSAPNFTDDGFHNVGLKSFDGDTPDMGRHSIKPIRILKGAFKTPTLRDISLTAPYFHDGSAETLMDVIEHYVKGGEAKSNLSPNMKALKLSKKEKKDLENFLNALTTQHKPFILPILPL